MKKALAFKLSDLKIPDFFSGVFKDRDFQNSQSSTIPFSVFCMPSYLLDRPACETNKEYIQLLPYVTLRYRDKETHEAMTFCYQRGSGSGEQRLLGKWSVGVGGHVEEAPDASQGKGLLDVLTLCAQREVMEEVGITLGLEPLHKKLSDCSFLWEPETEVGSVHLGMAITVFLPEKPTITEEKDIITRSKWVRESELAEMIEADLFENWSRLVIEDTEMS